MLVVLLGVAFAGEPSIPDEPLPASATPDPVLTIEFLRRIPTGRCYTTASEMALAPVCEDPICVGLARETWRRAPGLKVDPGIRSDGRAARRRHVDDRWRQDPLAVLPVGHTLDGFLRLFPGLDPHATVILDGAVLGSDLRRSGPNTVGL